MTLRALAMRPIYAPSRQRLRVNKGARDKRARDKGWGMLSLGYAARYIPRTRVDLAMDLEGMAVPRQMVAERKLLSPEIPIHQAYAPIDHYDCAAIASRAPW